MFVELSKSQCKNLAEWIDCYLLDAIRDDEYIDNLAWVKDMILAVETLEKAAKGAVEDEDTR